MWGPVRESPVERGVVREADLAQPDRPEWVDSGIETEKCLLSTWLAVQELGIQLHDGIKANW